MIESAVKCHAGKRVQRDPCRCSDLTNRTGARVVATEGLNVKDIRSVTENFRCLQIWLTILAIACFIVAVGPAHAQMMDAPGSILPKVEVRGRGWDLLRNPAELLDFGIALVVTTGMIALIAYHPVNLAARRTRADFDAPQGLFVYALIGMVVGFMIMHHGYLIGFVLFGLGGLLRFKSDDGSADTMRLILVTLIGLCVGLDLPVVALITTLSAWALIFVFGGPINCELEVRFSEESTIADAMFALRELLAERGFKTVSMSKTKFKPIVSYVVSGPRGFRRSELEREMVRLVATRKNGIADWHVE